MSSKKPGGAKWWERFPKNSRRRIFFSYCARRPVATVTLTVILIGIIILGFNSFDDFLNPIYWIIGSTFVIILAISLTFYVLYYFFWFRWYEHSGGRLIMQLIGAFEGLVLFTVLRNLLSLGGFLYPPPGTLDWWPLFRITIYAALSYSVIQIDINLVARFLRAQKIEFNIEPRTSVSSNSVSPTSVVIPITKIVPGPTVERSYESLPKDLENTFLPVRKSTRKNKR